MSPPVRASMPTIYASVPRGFRSWETFASSFLGRTSIFAADSDLQPVL